MPADEIHELKLFIDNDSQLYRSQTTSILKNLMTKKGQGKYDPSKAVKLWMYLVDAGAKKYAKEHGSPGQKWNEMFTKADREAVAKELNDDFEAEAKLGNYDDLLPKKYKKGKEEAAEGRVFDDARRRELIEAADGSVDEAAEPEDDDPRGKPKMLRKLPVVKVEKAGVMRIFVYKSKSTWGPPFVTVVQGSDGSELPGSSGASADAAIKNTKKLFAQAGAKFD